MPISTRSGNWSDPTLWDFGAVPITGDIVTIITGHTVVYDSFSDDILSDVTINGTLKISRTASTRLRTSGNIVVGMGGVLDMGTAADPIPATVLCEIIWVLTPAVAAGYVGGAAFAATDKGLWAMDGSVWDVHGASIKRTWSKLAQTAIAGASHVTVQHNVSDWYVGGQVIITMTNQPTSRTSGPWQNELKIITGIMPQPDGTAIVTLDSPLSFMHEGAGDFRGEVGLLSRNIRFSTQITGVSEATLISDVTQRRFAHTAWMAGATGEMQYAELKFMGHYVIIGRYPIHLHQMRDFSRGMAVRGNAIWYSGLRFMDVHTSHGVTAEDNVGYSCVGSGFYAESTWAVLGQTPVPDGVSVDTAWIHNLAIDVTTTPVDVSDQLVAFRRMGAFWPFGSVGEAIVGNVAVSTRGRGTDTGGISSGEGFLAGDTGGAIGSLYLHNESHSNGEHGSFSWHNRDRFVDFVDFNLWRNANHGAFIGAYNPNYYFYNAQIRQNGEGGSVPAQVAVDSTPTYFQDSVFQGKANGTGTGYVFRDPHVPEASGFPTRHVRNLYRDLTIGITNQHDLCANISDELNTGTSKNCIPNYSNIIGAQFQNVVTPVFFGFHWNANSFYRVADPIGMKPELGANFWLNRRDQLPPTAPISQQIIGTGSNSTYQAIPDAVVTPTVSWADYPPQVSLSVSMIGKVANIQVNASDDRDVPRVEIFVDWISLGVLTAPPYGISVDLSLHPRKFAYIYAVAYDNTAVRQEQRTESDTTMGPYFQRAYSNVVELGPEVLQAAEPPPPPPILVGDANGDGIINIADVLTIIDQLLGFVPAPPPGSTGFIAADANRNAAIDLGDAIRIIDFLLGALPTP